MDITINASFLPHTDPEQSLAFYRDALGFEVRKDVGYEDMRWITIGPSGRPDMNIVLTPPAADPGITEDERRTIAEMMAKGTYASIMLATTDLDALFRARAGQRCRSHAGAHRPTVGRARLRLPRPRRKHSPDPGAALNLLSPRTTGKTPLTATT